MLALVSLSACQSFGTGERVQSHIRNELSASGNEASPQAPAKMPEAVTQELLDSLGPDPLAPDNLALKRFEVAANEVDIRAFFSALVDGTPYSVAVHPEVVGSVTLTLKDVSLDDVLKVITRMYPLDVFREGKVVQVLPARMRTESIPVNYLMMKRSGMSTVSVVAGGVTSKDNQNGGFGGNQNANNTALNNTGNTGNQFGGMGNSSRQLNGSTIQTSSENDFWTGLKEALEALVGKHDGRYVIVSPQASMVTVHALPSEIAAMKEFLHRSEESLQRQVILEARIIEVTLKDEYQQGVNWTQILSNAARLSSTEFSFATSAGSQGNSISADLGGVSTLSFNNADFSGVISLLQTQGDVQMLSNPRVTATNNQKAVIKVGEDEYFVTDVSSTTTTGAATENDTSNIELTPFFSGIALDVTPQIDKYGSVILHVHPSVTDTAEQNKVINLGDKEITLPLAQSNIRESDTVIRAASGEIVVIGGLMQTITTDQESKTPLLGDIPLFGNLFRNVRKQQNKKELVILLKPTVVMPDSWQKQQQRSRELLNSWYRN